MDQSELERAIAHAELSDAQRSNALDLFAAIAGSISPKQICVNSYDGGLSLHWERMEIAAFADRFETYRFLDDDTIIHHWPRSPGEALNGRMLAELRAAIS